MMIEYYA